MASRLRAQSILCLLSACAIAIPGNAQIISQTPRPEVVGPDTTEVETIDREARIGRPNTLIKIPRVGAFLFAGFDLNNDYIIDKPEIEAGISKAFKRADRDGSGTLSLVELESWRVAALGSPHASPTNYDFAPNFNRTVSREKFTEVLQAITDKLDTDDQGEKDGRISIPDLLKDYQPRRGGGDEAQCAKRVREATRRVQQQCRTSSNY